MLTDEQRQIIEAEEQLRHEVRRRLDTENPPPPPPPPPAPHHGFGKRIFDFFNSSVGMWLLSSIVLTGGAALLQSIQHNHEVAQNNRQQLATTRFEVMHRLDMMEHGLRRARTVGEAKAAMDGINKSKFPLTPELQNRSLGSLYLTMHQLLQSSDQEKSAKAMTFIRRLEEAELSLQAETDDNDKLDEKQKEHMHKLVKSIKALHLPDL
jgi:hypothetical protein